MRQLRRISAELVSAGAVNADTGDVLDPLVRAWGDQWRQRLVEGITRAESTAQRRLERAEQRLTHKRDRAAAASRSVERTRALVSGIRTGGAATGPTATGPAVSVTNGTVDLTTARQVSNGAGTSGAH